MIRILILLLLPLMVVAQDVQLQIDELSDYNQKILDQIEQSNFSTQNLAIDIESVTAKLDESFKQIEELRAIVQDIEQQLQEKNERQALPSDKDIILGAVKGLTSAKFYSYYNFKSNSKNGYSMQEVARIFGFEIAEKRKKGFSDILYKELFNLL